MNKEIQNELNEIAPALAKLPRTNAFSVPAMYFSSLPEKIIAAAKAEEASLEEPALSPLLTQLKKSQAMQLPENYFAKSSASIIEKIRAEEVKEEVVALAPALLNFEKKNPFTVPANYFAVLPQRILQKIKAEETVAAPSGGWLDGVNNVLDKLLAPLFNPRLSFAFVAVLVGVMMFWFGIQQHNIQMSAEARLAAQLQSISTDEIRNYIAMNIDEFDEVSLSRKINFDNLLLAEDELFDEQDLLMELDEEFI